MARMDLNRELEVKEIAPSSPTGKIGQVVHVNPNGIAYMRIPKSGNSLKVSCYSAGSKLSLRNIAGGPLTNRSASPAAPESNDEIVTFTFDKIQNYVGQTADQIGLKEGAIVEFEAPEGIVESLKLSTNHI
jgi:hypothetical protein